VLAKCCLIIASELMQKIEEGSQFREFLSFGQKKLPRFSGPFGYKDGCSTSGSIQTQLL